MFQMKNCSCLRNLLDEAYVPDEELFMLRNLLDKAYVPDDLFLVCFI